MPEPIIQAKGLEITYNLGKENEYKATWGVDFEIYPGEFIAFFGPSGCGKSTIMYTILGVLAPSGGQLLVKGENPYSFSPEEMVNFQTQTIGIIYQAFFLIPSLSVVDNVALPQIFHGTSPAKRNAWALQLLKRFGMDGAGNKFADNLSGGQSQRVSVARALVNNPDILLADEPTGNLDSVSTKQVMDSLEEINMIDKRTVILITHNAAQLSYAHRVFYFKDGLLQRVVPNPEKKQIAKIDRQKILITEMDKLSKIYPYNTPTELKVKSIVNFLTQDFTFDQILKLEEFTQLMVERLIDKPKYLNALIQSFADGGVGIDEDVAMVMADKVEKVLMQSEDARRFRRRFSTNNFFSQENVLINRLTGYVVQEYPEVMTTIQKRRLRELVYNRIAGLISRDEFEASLATPLEGGGLGFVKKKARKLTLYFEKILIQGSEDKGHGH
ncbi:ABC transporter ATP-binding protein [Candidatus Parcubacteria bacterium]|nr:ABC transporter ATP-binding protein [Patescibacteria group bacterium]MBU4309449.1 ABC transporter ATP-binding protein [Patescibacteria group bacterium]MBU4432411.1 ABC transporter ATP-binding protein [Patescibacteria group bacterium]MBU4577810.1 ABC transporter ATP-binding protein [Patescibacteria group bacterium]MCG2696803.1 ABC transporter ATP-binding protein [Candidatus Parcubacteria bacterium]